mgnify:CR=1 FL=1
MRPKPEIVLRWLQLSEDNELEFPDGCTYSLLDDGLYMRLSVYRDGKPHEERWAKSEMSFNWFIEQCDRMEEDKIVGLAANLALNSLRPTR